MARTTSSNGGMEEKQGPSFFKIIKTDFNTEDLRIPPKFRKHLYLLNELSNRATLILKDSPNSSWTVEVCQTEGEIYFRNGWQKFIRDNSLGDFEFLVFSYDSDMQFSIEIFDRSQCKRVNYSDVRTDTEGGHSAIHTRICQSYKLKDVKQEEEDYQDNREEEEAATLPHLQLECRSFTRIIKKDIYSEAVPVDFSTKFLPRGYYNVVLKNSKGGEWNVGVVPNGTRTNTVKLSSGWADFRRDNNINCGDTCTFECVGSKKLMVHIDHK